MRCSKVNIKLIIKEKFMKLGKVLNELKENLVDNQTLNEAGIRIPKGARAAKIIHH
jgi:hypothetical protein